MFINFEDFKNTYKSNDSKLQICLTERADLIFHNALVKYYNLKEFEYVNILLKEYDCSALALKFLRTQTEENGHVRRLSPLAQGAGKMVQNIMPVFDHIGLKVKAMYNIEDFIIKDLNKSPIIIIDLKFLKVKAGRKCLSAPSKKNKRKITIKQR